MLSAGRGDVSVVRTTTQLDSATYFIRVDFPFYIRRRSLTSTHELLFSLFRLVGTHYYYYDTGEENTPRQDRRPPQSPHYIPRPHDDV